MGIITKHLQQLKNKPTCLITCGKSVNLNFSKNIFIDSNYQVRRCETHNKISFQDSLQKHALEKKISFLWVMSHGNRMGIKFSENESLLSINSLESLQHTFRKCIDDNALVVLNVCNTAKEDFARRFSTVCPGTIYAAHDLNIEGIVVEPNKTIRLDNPQKCNVTSIYRQGKKIPLY